MVQSSQGGGSGGGTSGQSWTTSLFDGARNATADLYTELSSFAKFQRRVDDLIRDLKGSEAGPGKVGQERLARHQLGGGEGGWAEAAGLFGAYETVITELESLSKVLSDSIEGMGIAVMAAHKGYENIDVDILDRMRAITVGIDKHGGGTSGAEGTGAGQEQPSANDAGGSI
ncbi:hypothetical protein ACQB60_33835 [Actinomycetota bacterium Odt1-20B]